MKKYILILTFLVSLIIGGYSQSHNLPIDSMGNVVFKEIVNTNLSQSKLYSNAQEWIAKTFGDYKSVIQFEDKENGKLILKGSSAVRYYIETHLLGMTISNRERIEFTLTIDCRENKYRYIMDNIVVVFETGGESFHRSILDRINRNQKENNEIKNLKETLQNLKNMDTIAYNKTHLSINDIELQIESKLNSINGNVLWLDSELEAINSIIPSLKKAMSKFDDF